MEKRYTIYFDEVTHGENAKIAVIGETQGDVKTHDHNFFELAYITGGTAVHTLNGMTEQVGRGDYFLVDYGSVHSYTDSRNFSLINCLFYPEIIDETLIGCKSVENLLQVCLIRYYRHYAGQSIANRTFHDSDGSIQSILTELEQECTQRQIGYEEIFRCRLLEILIRTMRKAVSEKSSDFAGNTDKTVVSELVAFINKNYAEKSLLNRFCEEHHYSVPYISRIFHQETGISASEYLRRVRMEIACGLLNGSNMQVQEIARSCGYEDVTHFRKLFSEMFHMTPRDFRACKGRK